MTATSLSIRGKGSARAYSLVELLVSLGIIAVLAAIVILVARPGGESADAVRCISNLKSLGLAIQVYTVDHGGTLPGALTDGQRLGYDKSASDKNHFPVMLGAYLGLPKPTTEKQYARTLACPAWEKKLGPSGDRLSTPCYLVERATVNGVRSDVFGRTTEPKQGPMRFAAVDTPALQIAVIDADAGLAPNYAGRMPDSPVHGKAFRHALFFDWHVARTATGL